MGQHGPVKCSQSEDVELCITHFINWSCWNSVKHYISKDKEDKKSWQNDDPTLILTNISHIFVQNCDNSFRLFYYEVVFIFINILCNRITCGNRLNSVQHRQYNGCWCLGSAWRTDISNHNIDYVEYMSSCLTWGRIQLPVSCQCGGMIQNENVCFCSLTKIKQFKG